MMKNLITGLVMSAALLFGTASCGEAGRTEDNAGDVRLVGAAEISIPLMSDQCNVTSASATISGDQIPTPIEADLTVDSGPDSYLGGTIGELPVGNVSFLVRAFNDGGHEVYVGDGEAIITAGNTTSVTVILGRNFENCPLPQPTGSVTIAGLLANDMAYVPAGVFKHGIPVGGNNWTSEETVESFLIDIYEVTAKQFMGCVDAGTCTYGATGNEAHYGDYFNYDNNKDNHPINFVTWQEASTYCEYVGKRLPSRKEWEKAARGTDGRTHPWGEGEANCTVAVLSENDGTDENDWGCGNKSTMEVGSRPAGASPYGAMDMIGNVWEWTDSWDEFKTTRAVSGWGLNAGGSIYPLSEGHSVSYIWGINPALRKNVVGFRCAL